MFYEQKLHKLVCVTCFKNRGELQKADVVEAEVDDIIALSEHQTNELKNLKCLIDKLLEEHEKLRAYDSHLKAAEIQDIFDQSAKALTGHVSDPE